MLKKILTSLALTVGIAHHSNASEITQFPTYLNCLNQQDLSATITEFEEISFAGGISIREIPDSGMVTNNLIIFVNPKTMSWTIVERFSKDLYCVVALGEKFRPLSGK